MTEIRVDDVTKVFGRDVVALDAISAVVADGSVHAVLGPSGCGKTTLLRVLAGFERIDAGTVTFDGEPMTTARAAVAPERRRVGIVPQDGALFPHLDVAANVAFGIRREPATARRERVAELLALTGLDGLERRRPHQLSGGQQQRVALARALAPRPRVVLLDEPFAALDTSLRAGLRDEVAMALRATGTTAVIVTHDQAEAFSMADAVSLMRAGRVVQTATPRELYERPGDLTTARFVGATSELPGRRRDSVVECALGTLRLASGPPGDPGDVVVVLRPEQVVPATDGIPARVRAVRFTGPVVGVTLDVGSAAVEAQWPSHAAPALDSTIHVAVAGGALAFPAGADADA